MKRLSLLAVALLGIALPRTSAAQTAPSKEFLPPLPAGKEWKLIWNDEFDGTKLDETKWNRHGDQVHRDGSWVKAVTELPGACVPVPGFGSSDCDCEAHLFRFERMPSVRVFGRRVKTPVSRIQAAALNVHP